MSDNCNARGSWAELRLHERAPKVVSSKKTYFWIEIVPDEQMVDSEPVPVTVIGECGLIACVILSKVWRLGACVIAKKIDVVIERERTIKAVRLIGTITG